MPLIFSRYGFYDEGDTLLSSLGCPVAFSSGGSRSCDADCGLWVWRSDETCDDLLRQAALDDGELAAYSSISSESRRREFLTGIVMVSSVLGLRLSHHADGAPFLTGDSRYISLSHTADVVVMAVDRKPVGVDVEASSRDVSRVAGRMFTAEERVVADDIVLWCVKEAAYKAYGHRGMDFRRDIRVGRSRDGMVEVAVDGYLTDVRHFLLDGFMVAVTV